MKQWIARKILLCSLLLLSISGYFLADMLMQERKDDALQEQLKEIYEKSGNGETEGLSEEETNDGGRDTGGDSSGSSGAACAAQGKSRLYRMDSDRGYSD